MGRQQPSHIYESLYGSSASDFHVRSVLQISKGKKGLVKSHIEGKIVAKGIEAGELLRSTAAKVKVTEIIEELKTEAIYHGVFNKALVLGEPFKDVNRAIHQLICITQHARNKIRKTRSDGMLFKVWLLLISFLSLSSSSRFVLFIKRGTP